VAIIPTLIAVAGIDYVIASTRRHQPLIAVSVAFDLVQKSAATS
jgi:hypothetical protein